MWIVLQEYGVSGPLLQDIQYLHIHCLVYHGDTMPDSFHIGFC